MKLVLVAASLLLIGLAWFVALGSEGHALLVGAGIWTVALLATLVFPRAVASLLFLASLASLVVLLVGSLAWSWPWLLLLQAGLGSLALYLPHLKSRQVADAALDAAVDLTLDWLWIFEPFEWAGAFFDFT